MVPCRPRLRRSGEAFGARLVGLRLCLLSLRRGDADGAGGDEMGCSGGWMDCVEVEVRTAGLLDCSTVDTMATGRPWTACGFGGEVVMALPIPADDAGASSRSFERPCCDAWFSGWRSDNRDKELWQCVSQTYEHLVTLFNMPSSCKC